MGEYPRFLGKFQVNTLECIISLNSLALFEMLYIKKRMDENALPC